MDQEFDALGYLQAVYQGKIIAEGMRMKAAIACLPFEVPKLSVSANYNIGLGSRMEAAIAARGVSPVIGALPQPADSGVANAQGPGDIS